MTPQQLLLHRELESLRAEGWRVRRRRGFLSRLRREQARARVAGRRAKYLDAHRRFTA